LQAQLLQRSDDDAVAAAVRLEELEKVARRLREQLKTAAQVMIRIKIIMAAGDWFYPAAQRGDQHRRPQPVGSPS
jgi:hypothetical protein